MFVYSNKNMMKLCNLNSNSNCFKRLIKNKHGNGFGMFIYGQKHITRKFDYKDSRDFIKFDFKYYEGEFRDFKADGFGSLWRYNYRYDGNFKDGVKKWFWNSYLF